MKLDKIILFSVLCSSSAHASDLSVCQSSDFDPGYSTVSYGAGCFDGDFIQELIGKNQLDPENWDEGWGYSGGVAESLASPFCRTVEALELLYRTRGSGVVEGAGEYVLKGGGLSPSCHVGTPLAEAPAGSSVAHWILGTAPGISLHIGYFEMDTVSRAASLVHEARHVEGRVPHGNNDCVSGQGKTWPDLRCDDFFGDTGPYTRQVEYLRELVAAPEDSLHVLDRPNMTLAGKQRAAATANSILSTKFRDDSGFRVRSPGYGDRKRAFLEPVDPRLIYNATCGRDLCQQSLAQGTELTACFLSRIQGEFNGFEDSLFLDYQLRTWGGVSGVRGNFLIAESNSDRDNNGNVTGDARCLPIHQNEYNLQKPTGVAERSFSLGSAHKRACYLRGVSGRFDNDGEYVGVAVEGGEWVARIRGNDGGGMEAWFGCVATEASQQYSANDNAVVIGPMVGTVDLNPDPVMNDLQFTNTCALTSIYGDFAGHDEYVAIGISDGNPGTPVLGSAWTLNVHDGRDASSGTVGGSMVCFDL